MSDHPAFKPFDQGKKEEKELVLTYKHEMGKDGTFQRKATTFRKFIKKDGEFPPESGRYHLYVCWGCPWANRTLIMRALKGLESVISVSFVVPELPAGGWYFDPENGFKDPHGGRSRLRELYLENDPDYSGTVTVPTLYDTKTKKIVNNESSEIIRMLNTEFNEFATKNKDVDYYPESLRKEIDEVNSWIYTDINNGVYKVGFAANQVAFEGATKTLFDGLERLEKVLAGNLTPDSAPFYLVGGQLTEADVRLWVTLVRFCCYEGAFKCNYKQLTEYPSVYEYMVRLYKNLDAFKTNVRLDQCRNLYYKVDKVNPSFIVPLGPRPKWYEGPWSWNGKN